MKRILFTLLMMGLILSHVGVSYSEDESKLKYLQDWFKKNFGKNYSIKELKNLKHTGGYVTSIPKDIGELKNLRSIYFANTYTSIPKSILKLKHLQALHLINCHLETIPEFIGELKNLRTLVLKENRLTSLPKSIGKLKNLRYLDLNFNRLTSLPKSIGQLKNLEYLDLGFNRLTSLPKSIGQLKNLKYLNLGYNHLTSLPKSIGELKNLETLILGSSDTGSWGRLRRLPDSMVQLVKLKYLSLSYNRLKTLPKSFGRLKSLEHLDLSDNQLDKLPVSIGQLRKLKHLDLSHNRLKTVPKSLGQLKNLEYLNLSDNQLDKLPASIGELMKLKYLNSSHNHLKKIPVSLAPLARKLKKKFYIFGNQIDSYPKFVNMDLVNEREQKLTIKKREKKEKQAREQRKLEAEKDYNERFKGKILMGPSYQFLYLIDRGDFRFAGFSYQYAIDQKVEGYGSIAVATDNYFRFPIGGAIMFLAISPFTYGFGGSKVGNSLLPLLLMDGLEFRGRIASWFYVSGFLGYSLNIPLKDKNDFLFINEFGFRLSFYPFKGFTIAPFASGLLVLLHTDVGYSVGINLGFYF